MHFLLAALVMSGTAQGGVFQHKTMHAEWPDRQVEQELVLPKGWWEVQLAVDHKATGSYRNLDGEVTEWEHGATWQYSRLWIEVAHGFSARTQIYLRAPVVRAHLANDRGAKVTTVATGDAHTGLLFQPFVGHPWAFAFRLDLKAPSGVEWPSEYAGSPQSMEGFLTGTGITNLGMFAHGQWRFGRVARVRLAGGYVLKPPGIVGYVMEVDGFGNGWLDPGDEVRVHLDATVQPAKGLAVTAEGTWSWRNWYRMGVSGSGLKLSEMYELEEPASFFDAGLAVDLDPSPHWGLTVAGRYQVLGGTTMTFGHLGLEEYAPQPGVTLVGKGRVRW
jgi:hypothetical protein